MQALAPLLIVPALALSAALLAQNQDRTAPRLNLHYAVFDPLLGQPFVDAALAAQPDNRLFVVQFHDELSPSHRESLRALDVQIHWYAPEQAWVVRMDPSVRPQVAALPSVRWVGAFHPAYKLQPALLPRVQAITGPESAATRRYDIVLVDPQRDEAALVAAVGGVGGTMWRYAGGNLLIEADLTAAQLLAIAREDTVLWIQEQTEVGTDMVNARIQGGANYVEGIGGYTGKGIRGHIMEGIYPTHPEFAANAWRAVPTFLGSGTGDAHGNATFGEVFSRGADPQARGMLPDGQGFFTNYNYIINTAAMSTAANSRYGVVQALTDPAQAWKCMFQTASWGYAQITTYDARSAEMDWIIHRFDIPITQSQSNTGNQQSRPQAWAKNIISVGAINHLNTANPNDDTQSGTSMGPATDGRIKPELCAYYDAIYTTNGATTYQTGFGGTSGATPMVCGHLGILIELFTDGLFGHQAATAWNNRFPVKPHFSTAKALLINTARLYDPAINGAGAASRYRQGWGFPSLQDLYDQRNNILALDELDVLAQGQTRSYWAFVRPGAAKFRATMVYADLPTAAPFSNPHRVNNLNLEVTSPGGVVYHGNNGLVTAMVSTPGGAANNVDTVENVYTTLPQGGVWRVDVSAPLVALDQHTETPAVDADFALVLSGISGGRNRTGPVLDLASSGAGNLTVSLTSNPAAYTDGFVLYSLNTARPVAMGNFLGIEFDALSQACLAQPAALGSPFHFTSTATPGVFPNATYSFPAAIALALQGVTLDGVAFYLGGAGVVAASNVDRVTVQ